MKPTTTPQEAARLVGHAEPRPARQPEPEEWIAFDHPDRRVAAERTLGPIMLRVDASHELPLVAAVLAGGRLKPVARFARAADCARAFGSDGQWSLPEKIVRQLAGQA